MTCILRPLRQGCLPVALCGRPAPASSLTLEHWRLAQADRDDGPLRGHVARLHGIRGNELCDACVSAANGLGVV